jgi:hypothetical protein
VANRFAALALDTGDLDGDHAGDLIGLLPNRASVLFGSSLGLFGEEANVGFGLASGTPVVGDLDQDGFDDVIVPTFLGVYVARGAPTPPLLPTAYAPLRIPPETAAHFTPVDGDAGAFAYPGEEVLAVIDHTVLFFGESPPPSTIVQLPPKSPGVFWSASELAGRVPKHKRGPGFPSVFVLAFRGDTSVHVYSVVDVDVGGLLRLPKPALQQSVALPGGYVVAAQGAQLVDTDDDGNPDIFIAVEPAGGGSTYVAISRSLPPFETPAVLQPGFQAIAERSTTGVTCGDSAFPLAVSRQNGRFVVVGTSGVCRLDTCGPPPCHGGMIATALAINASGAPWIEAFFADVNRDDHIDVAATTGVFSVVDFFITDGGRYNPFFASTFDPASTLRHGDFDGDFVEDVAIIEEGGLSGRGSSLSILYGKSQGAPEPPISVGSFPPVVSLEPGNFVKNALFQNDAIDDLFVQFEGDGEKGLTVLFGQSQRSMLAPFTLVGADGEVVPTAVLPAQLDGDGVPDLFASGGGRLWFLRGTGDGDLEKLSDVPLELDVSAAACVVWTAGHLGSATTDVIIGLTNAAGSRTCTSSSAGDPDPPEVVVVHPEGGTFVQSSGALPVALGLPVAPLLADLDGDGGDELLVAIRGGMSPLRIFWSTAEGLALDDSHTRAPALPAGCATCQGTPFSLTVGNFDDDETQEVLLFADSGVWVFDVDLAAKAGTWRAEAVIPAGTFPFTDGDVRLVDLDGDGVLDVALSQAAVVLARRSVPLRF